MIRDRDRGARELIRNLESRPSIRVGVIGEEASARKKVRINDNEFVFTTDTVVDIATIHEFGLGVPQRSFIAEGADEIEPEALRLLKEAAKAVKNMRDLEIKLDRFGLWVVGRIKERIQRGIPPGLDQRTIDRKDSSKPLIDTGQLISSITHEVKNG